MAITNHFNLLVVTCWSKINLDLDNVLPAYQL